MARRLWSNEEIELLTTDMSSEEIARVTNRTLRAVQEKRSRMTGHWDAVKKPIVTKDEDKIRKESRILALAHRIGVKLFGK